MTNDQVNGMFELLGAFAIMPSIRRVLKDKAVAGISWFHVAFFTAWGGWNLFYYPSLNQYASFTGGIAVAIANTIYLALLLHYGKRKPEPKKTVLPQAHRSVT